MKYKVKASILKIDNKIYHSNDVIEISKDLRKKLGSAVIATQKGTATKGDEIKTVYPVKNKALRKKNEKKEKKDA